MTSDIENGNVNAGSHHSSCLK